MRRTGHFAALVTILIWGTTFISTKLLLASFTPIEILFSRFVLGWAALWVICPRRLRLRDPRREGVLALAGLCGVCLYYLLENIALTRTLASNVGVILSVAPFFTALITHFLHPREGRLGAPFFVGFAAAMAGVCLISLRGSAVEVHPAGDLLALLAAVVWACYSVLSRRISAFGEPVVLTTRRVFGYGLLFLLPVLPLSGARLAWARFAEPAALGHLLFLGLGASALCFVTWNFAVRSLGAVRTSVYIYLVPVITMAASALVLHEKLTPPMLAGAALTLAGLMISEWRHRKEKDNGR